MDILIMVDNKRVSGSSFQSSPKSPSATSDARRALSETNEILGFVIERECKVYHRLVLLNYH